MFIEFNGGQFRIATFVRLIPLAGLMSVSGALMLHVNELCKT